MEAIIEAPQETTAIVPVEERISVLTVTTAASLFVANGMDPILQAIHDECAKHKPDISTEKGRKAIASLAYKVARSKTKLDELGKDLVADKKAEIAIVDAERKRVRENLDALKDEVRRPLDEFEEREAKRIGDHERCLTEIEQCSGHCYPATSEQIERTILEVRSYQSRDWQEFAFRAEETINVAIARLEAAKTESQRRYDEAAELERLRAEEARRQQEERERRIAEEAATQARREAEAQAERERLAAEAKAKEELEAAERKAREAAEATARAEAARQAEEQRKIDELARLQREADERARVAEEARLQAIRDAEAAVERERQRVADEQAAQAAEEAKREANRKHRAKINGEACEALMRCGLPESAAKNVVIAIAKGEVPHIKISY